MSGEIECDLPVRDAQKKIHRFTAILNEPDGEMNLSTKSGDITIEALDGHEEETADGADVTVEAHLNDSAEDPSESEDF